MHKCIHYQEDGHKYQEVPDGLCLLNKWKVHNVLKFKVIFFFYNVSGIYVFICLHVLWMFATFVDNTKMTIADKHFIDSHYSNYISRPKKLAVERLPIQSTSRNLTPDSLYVRGHTDKMSSIILLFSCSVFEVLWWLLINLDYSTYLVLTFIVTFFFISVMEWRI